MDSNTLCIVLEVTPAEVMSKVISNCFHEISNSVINTHALISKFGEYLRVSKHIQKCRSEVWEAFHNLQISS